MVLAGPWSDPSTITSSVLKDLTGKFVLDLTEKMKHTQIVLFTFYIAHCSTDFMQGKISAGERIDLAMQGMLLPCPSMHVLNYEYQKYLTICQT